MDADSSFFFAFFFFFGFVVFSFFYFSDAVSDYSSFFGSADFSSADYCSDFSDDSYADSSVVSSFDSISQSLVFVNSSAFLSIYSVLDINKRIRSINAVVNTISHDCIKEYYIHNAYGVYSNLWYLYGSEYSCSLLNFSFSFYTSKCCFKYDNTNIYSSI